MSAASPERTMERLRAALRHQYRAIFPQSGMWQYNRLPLISETLPFLLLWSQKAASTVVLKWFFLKAGLLEEALRYNSFVHVFETEIFKKRPSYAHAVKKALENDGLPVLKFVRDPAARAFSSYLFLNRPLLYSLTDDPAFYWRRRALQYARGANAPVDSIFSFTEFLSWLNEEARPDIDGHLAPQYTKIEEQLGTRLQIYRAEMLDEAIAEIETRFALPRTSDEELNAIRESKHHRPKDPRADTLERIINEGLPNPATTRLRLPEFDTATMQAYPKVKALISAYFADDYRAYGYKLDE